jgi:hypothetical protein
VAKSASNGQECLKWLGMPQVAGCRKWQIWVAASGSSGDCPQVGLKKYWGCCNQVCQMTNVREGFPGILRVIIASPLDQIFAFLPNSLLGQNSLHCIHPTTLIRVQRRWCSHRHRSRRRDIRLELRDMKHRMYINSLRQVKLKSSSTNCSNNFKGPKILSL